MTALLCPHCRGSLVVAVAAPEIVAAPTPAPVVPIGVARAIRRQVGAFAPIVEAAAMECSVHVTDLLSVSRFPAVVLARQMVALVIRRNFGRSLPEIGRILDRDHSSVSHMIDRLTARMAVVPGLRERVERVTQACEACVDAAFSGEVRDVG